MLMAYSKEQIGAHKASIYALVDPRTGEMRYIGKANDAQKRYRSHMRDCRRRSTPVYCWIKSLVEAGVTPELRVLEVCQRDWRVAERERIAAARADGARLLNIADGGDEPFCSSETRAANGAAVAKLRASTPERKRIYELKRALGQLLKDGCVSEATKAKMRYAAVRAPHLFGAWARI